VTEIEYSTAAAEFLPAQSGNGVSDLLKRTIERHEAAMAYFASTVYLSDDVILGREPSARETVIYDQASDAESEALSDVCYFPARTPEDMAAKARHLRQYHGRRFGSLQNWQVENLLRSMLPDDERDALDDGDSDEGGELAAMIARHKEITGRINLYESGKDVSDLGELCDEQIALALKICGYRARTDGEQLQKAEFLRDWTRDSQLTEKEQKALIASMLPEGGDA